MTDSVKVSSHAQSVEKLGIQGNWIPSFVYFGIKFCKNVKIKEYSDCFSLRFSSISLCIAYFFKFIAAKYAELYRERKEKIERVFADAKEKHAMRYTPYRGLTAVTNLVKLKFGVCRISSARSTYSHHMCLATVF